MATIKEEALAYQPPQTLNVADLDYFLVELELRDGSGKTKDGEHFKYKYVLVDGKEYRVPGSVIGGIKALLAKMPQLKMVSVIKQGEGMSTRYQVIPYMKQEGL